MYLPLNFFFIEVFKILGLCCGLMLASSQAPTQLLARSPIPQNGQEIEGRREDFWLDIKTV